MKLRGCRFLCFFSLCEEIAFVLILEHSNLRGVKQKKHEILAFKPLLQKIRLKKLTIRKMLWITNIYALNWKKKTCCWSLQKWREIELCSPPYGFIKNLWQIHLWDSHVNFTWKNKVYNTTWAKSYALIGQKQQNSFQQTHRANFFVSCFNWK